MFDVIVRISTRNCNNMLLSLLFLSVSTLVRSQNVCSEVSSGIIRTFPESDRDPLPSDLNFYRTIIADQPYNVTVLDDVVNVGIPFDKFFVLGYSDIIGGGGYFVHMTRAIDRDTVFGILKILIMDINDNAPEFFPPSPFDTIVSESAIPGFEVLGGISVLDKDDNQFVTFSMSSYPDALFNGTGIFAMNAYTGTVTLNAYLDYDAMYLEAQGDESKIYYKFIVMATDSGVPALSSTNYLYIEIKEADDMSPAFIYPTCLTDTDSLGQHCISAQYQSSIQSGSNETSVLTFAPIPKGTSDASVKILAEDRDAVKSSLTCHIVEIIPVVYDGYFSVQTDPMDGTGTYKCVVRHKRTKPIYTSDYPVVRLILKVQENTVRQREENADLYIDVIESNGVPGNLSIAPSLATGYVAETASLGTAVSNSKDLANLLQFVLTDPTDDSGGISTEVSIYLYPDDGLFDVTYDGYLRVSSADLDYEAVGSYHYQIAVDAFDGRSAFADVTIELVDVNDNTPIFSNVDYRKTIAAGDYSGTGRLLFTFQATDSDGTSPNNLVSYTIKAVSPSADSGKFRLSSDGILFVSGNISSAITYLIRVEARDGGQPSRWSEVTFILTVKDEGSTNPTPQPVSDDGSLSSGLIIGIAVGAGVFVIIIIIIITICLCRRSRGGKGGNPTGSPNAAYSPSTGSPNPYSVPDDQAYLEPVSKSSNQNEPYYSSPQGEDNVYAELEDYSSYDTPNYDNKDSEESQHYDKLEPDDPRYSGLNPEPARVYSKIELADSKRM